MPFFDLFKHDKDLTEVRPGESLFREGDIGNAMYVLVEGDADIFIGGMLFEKLAPSSIVGEITLIDGAPRSATVVACTACKFAVIDAKRFHFLLDEIPGFAIAVMSVMAQRLKKCSAQIVRLNKNTPTQTGM